MASLASFMDAALMWDVDVDVAWVTTAELELALESESVSDNPMCNSEHLPAIHREFRGTHRNSGETGRAFVHS